MIVTGGHSDRMIRQSNWGLYLNVDQDWIAIWDVPVVHRNGATAKYLLSLTSRCLAITLDCGRIVVRT